MDVKKRLISQENINDNDTGILVSDLVKLLDQTQPLVINLFEQLNINEILDEFIPIKGAQSLFNSQNSLKAQIRKVDLLSKLSNISFYNDEEFCFNFNNIDEPDTFPNIQTITAYPLYSAQRDFFSKLYGMDKYAKNLIDNGLKSVINKNLELIKELKEIENRYRLIHNLAENKYYLRAIVSKNFYFDYNNSIAVVVGLLILFDEMKNSGIVYSLKSCEYNESYIRMFFDTSETKELDDIGFVRNIIEISNDEIKRESLKFLSVCSINYDNGENDRGELFIKPKDIKSKIFSIKHNQKPETAVEVLSDIENSKKIHEELYKDIENIKTIRKPEQIKFIIKRKIDNAKNDDIKKFQSTMSNELTLTAVNSIMDLLKLFNKLQLIAQEDIEASEYLRFLFYETIVSRK